jgi:isocitrate/isopropylmalate dehydrogenase
LHAHADVVNTALDEVLMDERLHTPDLGGQASTTDVIQKVISLIQQQRNI